MTKEINERELVLEILLEIMRDHVKSHVALQNTLGKYQYLEKRERAFITRVTEGTLEHMIEIDYILNQFSSVKVNKMKPVIRMILRSAVYQMRYMDSVPDSAVCNEAVKLAVKKGFRNLKGFVNGVLRTVGRNKDQMKWPDEKDAVTYLSVRYSIPEWMTEQFLEQYGRETTEKIFGDFQREKPLTIRCNLQKQTPEKLAELLREEGVNVKPHPYLPYAYWISGFDYLGSLKSFQDGAFQVQDLSSMLVTELAAPKKGDYVIDVCAAPGGKALHMAEKLEGTGLVEARDLTTYKTELIEENVIRLGFENVTVSCQDATVPVPESEGRADIVIADLPCSGLGVLGKKTDLKYNITQEMQKELVKLQREILTVVRTYVKPGGKLIYSTCTLNREENEENVSWFLESAPEFLPVSLSEAVCDSLKSAVEGNMLKLLPGIYQSDGFFISVFQKKE